jgi:hypothetical protein
MVHLSTSTWPIEYANLVKVLYEATPPSYHGSHGFFFFFGCYLIISLSKAGSKAWHHIAHSWKVMAHTMIFSFSILLEGYFTN